jgi:serine/threonine protein kinase
VPLLLAGKFLVERRIGQGGMGVVYSAWDQSLDRRVAIKTLPRTTTAAAVRLRREARAMARVSHPNVAQVLALETWRGIPVIVAEYLANGTLADRLATGPQPTDWVLGLGVVLAGALDDLHRAGLLHRDVKPSNIGFSDDDTPKLLDFGVAEMLTNVGWAPAAAAGSASDPLRSARFGTPGYLPPEASSGAAPTPAWDLWSLALVLYECVAGRNPLLGDGQPGTGGSVRRPEVPDVRRYSPLCPAPLAEFLGAALSTSPHRRPSSSVDFRNRLLGLLAVRPAA